MAIDAKTRNLILIIAVALISGYGLLSIIAPLYQHPAKQVILTSHAPKPIGPYSQAVQYGDFIFVSGQIGIDPKIGNLSSTVDGQTTQVMENLKAILQEAGLDFTDVVQTRIYMTDMQDFETVNRVYQGYFESQYPARATVQVAGLPKGAKIEIEMVAKRR
jgi:2-iminobutanoate/2-iminopropanoate deaminase